MYIDYSTFLYYVFKHIKMEEQSNKPCDRRSEQVMEGFVTAQRTVRTAV